MFITIITDCKSENDFGRQTTRFASLFSCTVNTVGVSSFLNSSVAELEAAGNLIDVLDAGEGKEGIVAVNVAPRGGTQKKWLNGTPFCFFKYEKTLVVSTYEGLTLSLIKKLNLIQHVNLTDIPTVMAFASSEGLVNKETADYIENTQFRSYEYLPKLAKWVHEGIEIPSKEVSINEIATVPSCVWYIDSFGNCKTTLLPEELEIVQGYVNTKLGKIKLYERLKDVPHGETGIFTGSSGIKDKRFIEIGVQRENGSKILNLSVGDEIVGS
ncbi:MAG: SAM hydroxide adenosyltransferase [Patescibacteria group bacterium]